MLDYLMDVAPEQLDALMPEERHQVYKRLRLEVNASPSGSLKIRGAFGEGFSICTSEVSRS